MELPECPVCLQQYDERSTVPRVLACGHSVCEQCVAALPPPSHALPDALRCPACTQVVPFPRSLGPAALPKNIDLLRLLPSSLSSSLSPSISDAKSNSSRGPEFLPLTSDQRGLYSIWKDWILPQNVISLLSCGGAADEILVAATASSPLGRPWFLRPNQLVSLLPVVTASSSSKEPRWFHRSYTARIVEALLGLEDNVRDRLRFLAEASWKERRGLCRVYGLWMNSEDESPHLYLVSETFDRNLFDVLVKEWKPSISEDVADKLLAFGKLSFDLCEAVMGLHSQGVICGCLTTSCIGLNEFGDCLIDLNKVLITAGRIRDVVGSSPSGRGDDSTEAMYKVFVSPEILLELYDEGAGKDCGFVGKVGYGSDVWSLACILAMLLTGDELLVPEVLDGWFSLLENGRCENFVESYDAWKEKVVFELELSLLGTQFEPFLHVLTLCLSYDWHNRPQLCDILHCIGHTSMNNFLHYFSSLDGFMAKDTSWCCLELGHLFSLNKNAPNASLVEENFKINNASNINTAKINGSHAKHSWQEKLDGNLVEGIHGDGFKSMTLEGHNDCVTGLAIGGGFLFSSSFDKTINVWSLQDFSHIQSLKGHDHRVMAILVLDDTNKPLCISGDSGSGICLWRIDATIDQEPWKKWYEHNDWRYSGIHSLAVSGTGYLYSGSGDKSIKAWSLQDYSLSCTMTGHKSTVSSLAVANGVLYSGSWDGTIRLWWLHDHSPLAVLGEETLGSPAPILSLSIVSNLLVSSHENGVIKVWKNDVLLRSEKIQSGAIFALHTDKGSIFSGGWDKIIHVQELSENELEADISNIASINCDSVVTCLLYWRTTLFAGFSNKEIKLYYFNS
ncbi:transducin beta-like protein 3 [Canna indica]|uniref:Transducin beta-like protein 3 n=1 Tax=Canna indica TaxID=4628 RepID=A0AAQ3JQT7_9LILI|nr:transducin beta-like protein 3 [Canna indica]